MFVNNYKIIKKIGEGSSGTVYLSRKDNKQYAIKKINVKNFSSKEKKYLISEIIIQQKHNCKFIIKLVDLYYENHYIYIISEFASKGTLSQYIKNHKKVNIYLINKWLIQISLGLKYLHNSNIIHRDLKCDNVFLDEYYNIKIGDLGIVKILFQKKFAVTNIGTPYFMSPELFKGSFYNYKTDIWSLGCILYQLITNKLPFIGKNIIQLSNNIQKRDFNRNFYHALKDDYLSILDKLLDKNYKYRCDLNYILENRFLRNYLSIEETTNNITKMDLNIIGELEPINNWNMILNKVNSDNTKINHNYSNIKGSKPKLKSLVHKPTIRNQVIPESLLTNTRQSNKKILNPINSPPPIPERDYPTDTVMMETSFLLQDMIAKRNNKLERLKNIKLKKVKNLKSVKLPGLKSSDFKKYKKKNHAKYIRLFKRNYVSPYSKYN